MTDKPTVGKIEFGPARDAIDRDRFPEFGRPQTELQRTLDANAAAMEYAHMADAARKWAKAWRRSAWNWRHYARATKRNCEDASQRHHRAIQMQTEYAEAEHARVESLLGDVNEWQTRARAAEAELARLRGIIGQLTTLEALGALRDSDPGDAPDVSSRPIGTAETSPKPAQQSPMV